MPSDPLTPYEQGLRVLLERLGAAHPRYNEALTFEARLRENTGQARQYGDNENRRSERNEIVSRLNALALDTLQTSFNALCGLPDDARPTLTPVGDIVGGDKIDGDKVAGDKVIYQTVYQTFTTLTRVPPPPYRTAVLRMVEDYEAIFGGRDAELATLDAFLVQARQPYALLLAPTGRGKTALLIHWIARVQTQGDWHVVFVPISLRYQTASADIALGALATALAEYHGEISQLQTYNTSPDLLRPTIADYLRRPPPDDRRLLVVLDGLDEASGWHISRELFPRSPEPHVRIVASARQIANTRRADWLDQLGWRGAQTQAVKVEGLSRDAVADILQRMGNPLDALATDVDLLVKSPV